MSEIPAWEGAATTVEYEVQIGTWINWSRGRIMGATLTLNRTDGNLLIAFTAFFVGLVSSRFWRIACFIAHRLYSTPEPRDALHHQKQAILRNSASAGSGLWTFLQLAWTWRGTAKRCFLRILPSVLTSAFCLAAFTAAGGFSSQISSGMGNEVLIKGDNCAIVSFQTDDVVDTINISSPWTSNMVNNAANYAQQCYSTNSSGMFDCSSFVKANLPSTVDKKADCPFKDSICRSNDSNLVLDTGYIDTNKHLGINFPSGQNILFRSVTQCAPLVTEGYKWNASETRENFTRYNYGPFYRTPNYTYEVESLDYQYYRQEGDIFANYGANMILSSTYSYVLNGTTFFNLSDFVPIPDLFRPDADVMLAFLSGNGVSFLEKTEDPWYRATLPHENFQWLGDDAERRLYRPEEAASPMACSQQYQFCNSARPVGDQCGPLTGWQDSQFRSAYLFGITDEEMQNYFYGYDLPTDRAPSQWSWLLFILARSAQDISNILGSLEDKSLVSSSNIYSGEMSQIPDNQWQLDVIHWWATWLASIQAGVVNTAYGPTDPIYDPFRFEPFNSHVKQMCNSQKIMSTVYISFSLFGLYFTYITGVLIVIASYVLEPIFSYLYRRRNYEEYTYLEWTSTETLQLQRVGYQGLGSGTWSGYTDSIPKTQPGETMEDMARSYATSSSAGKASSSQEMMNSSITQVTPRTTDVNSDDVSLVEPTTRPGSMVHQTQESDPPTPDGDPISSTSSNSVPGTLDPDSRNMVQAPFAPQPPVGTPTRPCFIIEHPIPVNTQNVQRPHRPNLPQVQNVPPR